MDTGALLLGGTTVGVIVIGLVEIAKRFWQPTNTAWWLLIATALGIVLSMLGVIYTNGMPATFNAWVDTIFISLAYALALGKGYDEVKSRLP
jgi:hypothetical protein